MGSYNNMIAASGFSSLPDRKYYNLYTGTIGIKGDATNADKTEGFYNDSFFSPSSGEPWVNRGSNHATNI